MPDSPSIHLPGALLLQTVKLVRRDPVHGTTLLNCIDFSLAGGERVAISGASGSGKSVFLRALARLDPPDDGRLLWRGEAVADQAIPVYRRHVAYIAQRPALLDGSVEDNLRYPFSLKVYHGLDFDRPMAAALARQAGRAEDFLNKRASELSGGEAQIAALIRVIQLRPSVLLLDEPTASLDPASAREIEALVKAWFDGVAGPQKEAGPSPRASIWVSHDREQTRRVAGRQLTMSAGVLKDDGAR